METGTAIVPSYRQQEEFAKFFIEKGVTPQQVSFLILCEKKNDQFKALQAKELEIQQILLQHDGTIKGIEEALAKYRAEYTNLVEKIRKPYSQFIREKLLEPSMEFEKRVNPDENLVYKTEYAKLIELKKAEAAKSAEIAKYNDEKNRLLAHIKNEFVAIVRDYRFEAIQFINAGYQEFLSKKIAKPDFNAVKQVINEKLTFRPNNRFQRQLISDTDAQKFYAEWVSSGDVVVPDIKAEQQWALNLVDEKFGSYEHDLALITEQPELIKEVEKAAANEIIEVQMEAEKESAVNEMLAEATAHTPDFKTDYKPLTKKYQIDMVNTKEFAALVISTFMSNIDVLSNYLSITQWGNLKVSQMLATFEKHALVPNGKKFTGFYYKEVVK